MQSRQRVELGDMRLGSTLTPVSAGSLRSQPQQPKAKVVPEGGRCRLGCLCLSSCPLFSERAQTVPEIHPRYSGVFIVMRTNSVICFLSMLCFHISAMFFCIMVFYNIKISRIMQFKKTVSNDDEISGKQNHLQCFLSNSPIYVFVRIFRSRNNDNQFIEETESVGSHNEEFQSQILFPAQRHPGAHVDLVSVSVSLSLYTCIHCPVSSCYASLFTNLAFSEKNPSFSPSKELRLSLLGP